MSENIFRDDWIECLEAHYMHVIRNNDKVTQPSLTVVMQQAGFTQSDLAGLRVRATMHVDDVGADFVPDMNILETEAPHAEHPGESTPVFAGVDLPSEAVVVDVTPELVEAELSLDEPVLEAEALQEEDEIEPEIVAEMIENMPPQPDEPQQLSLF